MRNHTKLLLAIGTLSLVVAGGVIIGLHLRPKTVVIVPVNTYHDAQPAVVTVPQPAIGTHDYAVSMLPALTNDALNSLINTQRAKYSLTPLTLSPVLEEAAMKRCNDMVVNNYFSHTSPSGVPWSAVISPIIVYGTGYGENLASSISPTAQSVINQWMNSPEHKENILKPYYTTEGFAACETDHLAGDRTVAIITVEEFAQQLK